VLDAALPLAKKQGTSTVDAACRLDAAEAEVLLAEHRSSEALATVDRGLSTPTRDHARVLLLNVRGDALAQRGDVIGAEHTWRAAADSIEAWRASIPSAALRTGLDGHHRHALEAWLESAAARGEIGGALDVTRRMIGRGLLDRILQRDAGSPVGIPVSTPLTAAAELHAIPDADAWIDEAVRRLRAHGDLAAPLTRTPDLTLAPHDMVALMSGSRSIWALRRIDGRWSIDRVGDRASIVAQIDAYRRDIDDTQAAATLGAALFPARTLPRPELPLVVLLDRELADVALAGLRVAGKYLVERGPILELLGPELLFASVPQRAWTPAKVIGNPNGDLVAAEREAIAVASALEVQPVLGTRATVAAVANGAAARVLHIAAHSTLGSGDTALVLSDGVLSSLEIVRQKLAPRVAVIATCRSQVNDDPAISLVAAFLAAGTAGVVGVKRALDDADGATLMTRFYRAAGADNPMLALATAQRAAISNHALPHAWATVSFFGVGGWMNRSD
jgi:hypothetical protein